MTLDEIIKKEKSSKQQGRGGRGGKGPIRGRGSGRGRSFSRRGGNFYRDREQGGFRRGF